MDRDTYPVGRERIRLIRRREGLQVVGKPKKRRVLGRSTQWVHRAEHPNHVWSYDFVHDQTMDGRSLKCLTVVDEFTRENLAVKVNRSMTTVDVVRQLTQLMARHGKPMCLRSDNGPEFVAKMVQEWLESQSVGTHYIDRPHGSLNGRTIPNLTSGPTNVGLTDAKRSFRARPSRQRISGSPYNIRYA